MQVKLLMSCFTLLIMGCASGPDDTASVNQAQRDPIPPLGNVEYHTHRLAVELFSQVKATAQARYAVVSFVPVENYVLADDNHPLTLLGQQLREGMTTEAAKRGYITQDFLASNDIMVSDRTDRILTRDVTELSDVQQFDYYITGTMLYQQEGAIVNARVVNVRNKQVTAAATRFFPIDIFWRKEQVTSRQGRLYRQRVQPESGI